MNGQASKPTLISFPKKVPIDGGQPAIRGLRYRTSAITIGKSISNTTIDCLSVVEGSRSEDSTGNHPANEFGSRWAVQDSTSAVCSASNFFRSAESSQVSSCVGVAK